MTKAMMRALSEYIAEFEKDQVSVGLWAGDLVLNDVVGVSITIIKFTTCVLPSLTLNQIIGVEHGSPELF